MIPALPKIIHTDQRGFMKDRRISVNIRKMLDIMHQAEKDDLEAVILSLDFVKCFDKCSFSILHGSLDFFNFGSIVKEWTKILYKDFTVKIQNNGNFSQDINIKKGVHQGGCCSSVYFLVIAEILALALRNNQSIEGITIQDIRNLLNQFADDMDVFSLNTETSIKSILEELDKFRLQSGFTVSYEKTTLYRIGSLRHSDAQLYNIDQYQWSNKDINVLGVTIAHEDIINKNYNPIIDKARNTLNAWYNRGLSLIGKIQVVNALVASLFVYKMMVLPCIPKNIVKNVDNIIREFLWDKKKAKIAYHILQNPKTEGGLNLVNIKKRDIALKATWPQILLKEHEYSQVVYKIMKCTAIQHDIWRCSLKPEDVDNLKISNQFWKDVLKCWSEYNSYSNVRIDNQIIWFNSNIKIRKKPIMWNDLYKRGLKYVYQLFENGSYKDDNKVMIEFGLTKLRFNSLKVAIPNEWKMYFQDNTTATYLPLAPHNLDTHRYTTNLSNIVYKFIADDVITIHNKYIKWREELGTEWDGGLIDFAARHKEIYRITNVPKYRSFQYRILQRGIVTNIQLYKWNITESSLCFFCQAQVESLTHLFYHCPHTAQLWEQIIKYLEEKFGRQQWNITPTTVIFNQIVPKKYRAINFICLFTKQYLYKTRCLGKNIVFQQWEAQINNIENMEKYIAIRSGKLSQHLRKWHKQMPMREDIQTQNINQFVTEYIDNM